MTPLQREITSARCIFLGKPTGDEVRCPSCNGTVLLKLFECQVFGETTLLKKVDSVPCCRGCHMRREVTWACGVTTCPQRIADGTLEKTLNSLKGAGFDKPHLFIDGSLTPAFDLPTTCRYPSVGPWGNWLAGLTELLARNPSCHRFAMFQDDLLMSRNVRDYLSRLDMEDRTYWNLFSFPQNEYAASNKIGLHEAPLMGKGAVALVLSREGVLDLLAHRNTQERCTCTNHHSRGITNVDGGVYQTLKVLSGYREMLHWPCLVQHVGTKSTLISFKTGRPHGPYPPSESFRGEEWDAMALLK